MGNFVLFTVFAAFVFFLGLPTNSKAKAQVDEAQELAVAEITLFSVRAAFEACPQIIKLNPTRAQAYAALIRTEKFNNPNSPDHKSYRESLAGMKSDRTYCNRLSESRKSFKISPLNNLYFLWK
jgi:hypothetical protein